MICAHNSPIYDEYQTQYVSKGFDTAENGLIKTIQTITHNLYGSVKLTSLY